ncbi:hypothetical protein L2734_13790 [Parashewanella spongiae]|nr:hypothetical protein [Parashewanella spongiae]MCL1079219.1 hypothetical protein [Parashewanella spongiae]
MSKLLPPAKQLTQDLTDICGQTYHTVATSSQKVMEFLASSTSDAAYSVSVGATTGALVGSVTGPAGAAAGAVAGATVGAGHVALKKGLQLALSPFVSKQTAETTASTVQLACGVGTTYAVTESIPKAALSIACSFAGKKLSDKLVDTKSANPVFKGATDATFAALGTLAGHAIGSRIDTATSKAPNDFSDSHNVRRQADTSHPCGNNRASTRFINGDTTVNGSNGECGHFVVSGTTLILEQQAAQKAKIDLNIDSTVIARQQSAKKAEINENSDYHYEEFYDDAAEEAVINRNGDSVSRRRLNFHNDAGRKVTINENIDNDQQVLFVNNAGREATINQKSNQNRVVFSDYSGKEATVNQLANNDRAEFRDNAGQQARVNLNGDADETLLQGDSLFQAQIDVKDRLNRTANDTHINLQATNASGAEADLTVGQNGYVVSSGNAFINASVQIQEGGQFDAIDNACQGCSISVSGGKLKFNPNSALANADIVICKGGQVFDQDGTPLNRTEVEQSHVRSINELSGQDFDASCNPVTPTNPTIPSENTSGTSKAAGIALGILVPVTVVVVVVTPTGIILYVKRNEVKRCCQSLRQKNISFIKPRFSGSPDKQTKGGAVDLVAINIDLPTEAKTKSKPLPTKKTKTNPASANELPKVKTKEVGDTVIIDMKRH